MDNDTIWNNSYLYSVTNIGDETVMNNTYSIRNIKNCIARSTSIPCMHSALHSSIIAYAKKLRTEAINYTVNKGLYRDKKTVVDRW